ncbi:hypothetical protein [Chamaesiphon sp. VAR_48_metabat_403]|uniref:hypothetical protein n=1 Tax=Chamaesiphon sp. VAR_48_metabat_403 TaxID=2964700 RepID=UPI00286EB0A1|nr:hypothetical protein [Chamaesiphon sp. VAR_48_metabat_403]
MFAPRYPRRTPNIANSAKLPTTHIMKIKQLFLGITLAMTCLNPSMVLAQSGDIQQLRQRQADYQLQLNNLSGEMGIYMLKNPQPSAAALASIAGLGAIVTENLDADTKAGLAVLGVAGVAYCLDGKNIQYCTEVMTNLIGYGIKIDNYSREIKSISSQIRSLQE